jgi:hypothetical protein
VRDTLHTARVAVAYAADSSGTTAEWISQSVGAAGNGNVQLLASPSDVATLELVQRAALRAVNAPAADTARRLTLVFPGAAEAASLQKSAKLPSQSWMTDAIASLVANGTLQDAASSTAATDTIVGAPFVVVARAGNGAPLVFAAEADVGGMPRVVLFARPPVSSLATAALLVATQTASALPLAAGEAERVTLSDAQLKQMQREAATAGTGRGNASRSGLSDGRWLWLLALGLLGVEWYLRANARNPGADLFEAEAA